MKTMTFLNFTNANHRRHCLPQSINRPYSLFTDKCLTVDSNSAHINAMKSSVGPKLCWCALLCCLLFSLFDRFDPDPITKLPISWSFDRFSQQQVAIFGHPHFQLEEPRWNNFDWGWRIVSISFSVYVNI